MHPQVPIALRMSGHLLLGVVRIYSKKVEYLQHDYDVLSIDINKAFEYANINLPQDQNQANFESITLPDSFALDLMEIDGYNPNEPPENHSVPNEDISFADCCPPSISNKKDPAGHITIYVGEGATINSLSVDDPVSELRSVEIGDPVTPPATNGGFQEPDTNHIVYNDISTNEHVDPSPNSNHNNSVVKEISDGNSNDSSKFHEVEVPIEPVPLPKQTPSTKSAHSEPAHNNSDPHVSYVLAPSPQVAPARVKRTRTKYDKATVLTNAFMKKSINDPSELLRKRKRASRLDVWKLHNTCKKEKVLFDPIITGLSDNLCQMFSPPIYDKMEVGVGTDVDPGDTIPDIPDIGYSGGLSDISEELGFLEDDFSTSSSLKGTPYVNSSFGKQRSPPEVSSLLARTRTVAQYIKEKSTATPCTSESFGSVSLKDSLQGKTRKVCSRMFFETLV
ncbi:Rad21/Rec8-like protein, N-terminal [Artemisia annua]|uniref:Rad21/Rec8-like protein, N-terminal n=1 Tax=Artemisia annua TaxID=35608 RepID=A0A2U1PLC3_ARTAN|nr:Rad21/Rec8-like protein, N-terminal [Artemisia annua]